MPRSADIMLTAEELRLHKRKRRIWVSLALVLALAIVSAYFGGRSTLHAIKAWQSRRHAHKAFTLIEQEKWKEARDEATAAYQLYRTEPEAVRAVARFLTRVRNPEALDFWKQLRDSTSLTRQDLRDEATVALIASETQRATAAVKQLLADEKIAGPTDWLLSGQLALQNSAAQDAMRAAEKIFSDQKATQREMLQATLLELQAANLGDPTSREQNQADAWSRITKLAQGKTPEALDALVLLAQRALSSGGTRAVASPELKDASADSNQKSEIGSQKSEDDLARAIENHPLAKAPQKFVALNLQMQADPTQKEAIIQRAIAQWKDSDISSLATLATWLNGHGEFQRELDSIPLEKAAQNRDLFLQHLDALGALGRWTEIKDRLEGEGFPLEPTVQKMYLARCAAQLGEKTAAENNWKRALEAAGGDSQKLLQLAEFAEKNGELEIAEAACNSAAAQVPKLRIAQQGRVRIAQAQRDTKKMHAVLADMLKLWPNDTAIQNDEGYTRLLLISSPQSQVESRKEEVEHGEAGLSRVDGNAAQGSGAEQAAEHQNGDQRSEVGSRKSDDSTLNSQLSTTDELIEIEKLAEQLVKREPASLPHRTLLALALLKQDRPVAALDVYANIQIAPNAVSPSALAVHAAVLMANGQSDDARTEWNQIRVANLLQEEQLLIPPAQE